MSNDSDYIIISGLKHFCFCKRRWALVHIEQQWAENVLTLEGHYMHDRVHDSLFTEKRGSKLLSRGMPVRSEELGMTGVCDMVELYEDDHGISIFGRDNRWSVYPVEYKHGKPDERGADEIQLCAQAMCLEEMLVTDIPKGAIYYGELKRRREIDLSDSLRKKVRDLLAEMHSYLKRKHTPSIKKTKACRNCSMKEICQPDLSKTISVERYIEKILEEEGIEL